jgi:hypothetical protein
MRRSSWFLPIVVLALVLAVPSARAQDAPQWRPSTTEMPTMPTTAELQGDWLGPLGSWFGGLEQVSGVGAQGLRPHGTARPGSPRTQVARFLRGPVPVVVITDRNGDDRADMIEYFRNGSLVVQIVDADYSGRANVMRLYDAAGALIREERL